mmetsp:Transcript_9841/g.12142  ORF Transcript_9841/g.12142 Transcript_9841/m.12142 type:complete len:210 (-) Transcript_9841:1415-2044(-)
MRSPFLNEISSLSSAVASHSAYRYSAGPDEVAGKLGSFFGSPEKRLGNNCGLEVRAPPTGLSDFVLSSFKLNDKELLGEVLTGEVLTGGALEVSFAFLSASFFLISCVEELNSAPAFATLDPNSEPALATSQATLCIAFFTGFIRFFQLTLLPPFSVTGAGGTGISAGVAGALCEVRMGDSRGLAVGSFGCTIAGERGRLPFKFTMLSN